jgi:peptidoglycan hydrolase-like protein with peptidoglycan-binding domain
MHGGVRRAAWAAIVIALCGPAGGAVAAGRLDELAQNVSNGGGGDTEQGRSPAAGTPAASPANSPEQIRQAQTELKRLDCLKGRIDGKLGERTREAVRKFWASAKEPAVEVEITDQLIAELKERGDLFCRPPRPFFSVGGRAGGLPPFIAPGARPVPAPAPAVPVPPAAAQ